MKVLVGHNFYQQRGGEEAVFEAECALLESRGHKVIRYTCHNDAITDKSRIRVAMDTVYNKRSHDELLALLKAERPDVAHFHNTFPLISPSAYYACREAGVPVVQTLHNYRLLCPNALFFRDGKPCEDCLDRSFKWPSVRHACYRGNRLASLTVSIMLNYHDGRDTYRDYVDQYIVLTRFAQQKFIAGGLPAEKLFLKPNFVPDDPGVGAGDGGYGLYVGRLSQEKGVLPMLEAWKSIGLDMPLKIIGDGPEAANVSALASQIPGCEWIGKQGREATMVAMRSARCLVFPSVCYEGLPLTIIEAFAAGTPILATDIGAMSSLVSHGRTGLHFQPRDSASLQAAVRDFLSDPERERAMRVHARAEFESSYTADSNYQMLIEVYEKAMSESPALREGKT